jgi:hypothetical protein
MESLGREELQLLLILDLGTRWGWVVRVKPRPRFSPGERTPGTHCTRGWVGPRAGLDTEATGKIISPLPGFEPQSPGRSARSQTIHWLNFPAHPAVLGVRYVLLTFYFSEVQSESVLKHHVIKKRWGGERKLHAFLILDVSDSLIRHRPVLSFSSDY